jgi:excisionase family DNA binding protein
MFRVVMLVVLAVMAAAARENEGSTKLAYSAAEAGPLLGLHPQTVRRLVDEGRLQGVRVGRRLLIPRAAIDRFLEQDAASAAAK